MKPRVSKKSQREQRIRQNIIKASKQLFSKKGYKDTTVDEITDRAVIAKATLYQYFKSKENLFLETIKDSENNIIALFEKVSADPKMNTGKKKIRALFHYLLGYFEKDSYAIHMAFYRESYFNEEIISFIQSFLNRLAQKIQTVLIEAGMAEEQAGVLATSLGAGYVHEMVCERKRLKTAGPPFQPVLPYILTQT